MQLKYLTRYRENNNLSDLELFELVLNTPSKILKNTKSEKQIRRQIGGIEYPVVYFVIEDGIVVYVGKTCKSIENRLKFNLNGSNEFKHLTVKGLTSRMDTLDMEAFYIKMFAPIYNKAFTPDNCAEYIPDWYKVKYAKKSDYIRYCRFFNELKTTHQYGERSLIAFYPTPSLFYDNYEYPIELVEKQKFTYKINNKWCSIECNGLKSDSKNFIDKKFYKMFIEKHIGNAPKKLPTYFLKRINFSKKIYRRLDTDMITQI